MAMKMNKDALFNHVAAMGNKATHGEPIPNCPQGETPIRERAWTEGQMTDMHREGFERWAKDRCLFSLEREESEPQIYRDCMTSAAWWGFQAALRYRDEQEKQA